MPTTCSTGAHRGGHGCVQRQRCRRSLKNAIASDAAPLVSRLIDGGSANGGAAAARTRPGRHIVQDHPDCRAAQQLADHCAAHPARVAGARRWCSPAGQGACARQQRRQRQHPCGLPQGADATKLATTLRAAMAASRRSNGGAASGGGGASAPCTSTGLSTGGMLSTSGSSFGSSSTGGGLQRERHGHQQHQQQPALHRRARSSRPTATRSSSPRPSRCTASCAT